MIRLAICIPTVIQRKSLFDILRLHIQNQINELGVQKDVNIISRCDNKEISIGAKRQLLINDAVELGASHMVMIDDDDTVPYYFVEKSLEALASYPDCIGYKERCTFYNRTESSCFSKEFSEWMDNFAGYDHVRTPFFKSIIRTELCAQVGCKDLRFGEDHDFAKRIYPLLKTEVFIDEVMYEYRYKHEEHNSKYGIAR